MLLSGTARAQAVVTGEEGNSASPTCPSQGSNPGSALPGGQNRTRTEQWRQTPAHPSRKSFWIMKAAKDRTASSGGTRKAKKQLQQADRLTDFLLQADPGNQMDSQHLAVSFTQSL